MKKKRLTPCTSITLASIFAAGYRKIVNGCKLGFRRVLRKQRRLRLNKKSYHVASAKIARLCLFVCLSEVTSGLVVCRKSAIWYASLLRFINYSFLDSGRLKYVVKVVCFSEVIFHLIKLSIFQKKFWCMKGQRVIPRSLLNGLLCVLYTPY